MFELQNKLDPLSNIDKRRSVGEREREKERKREKITQACRADEKKQYFRLILCTYICK
jgi:hypothetical protein